jgi:hypothetical protein
MEGAMTTQAVRALLKAAFVDAINKVGLAKFKATSLFGSNDKKQDIKKAA